MSVENPDPGESQVLRIHFGAYWRAWRWLRNQFTPTSLAAVGTILAAAGGYVVHLRQEVAVVRERVVVLETRVVPVLTSSTEVAVLNQRVDDHEARLGRIESDWIDARDAAGRPPVARHKLPGR
jgi:hypothetical protein